MKDGLIVNGRQVDASTDFTTLIRGQLLGDASLSGRYDDSVDQGVWSLFSACKGTAVEERVLEAIKSLLLDSDKTVRSGAVRLSQAFADRFKAAELLQILDDNRTLFDGVTDGKLRGMDLSWGMLRAIAGAGTWTPPVTERIESAVKDPTHGATVLAALVDHEPRWVIENIQDVVAEQPMRAEVVLFRMKQPSLRERLVRAVPKESPRLRSLRPKRATTPFRN